MEARQITRRLALGATVPLAAAVTAAGATAGPAAAASAKLKPAGRGCESAEYWSASSPVQAWLPGSAPLDGDHAFAPGTGYQLTEGHTVTGSTSYEIGTQLGVSDEVDLEVLKVGDSVNISDSTTWSTELSTSASKTYTYTNTTGENAKPYPFVTGYRVKATLYQQSCEPPKYPLVKIRSKYVYLYQKNPEAVIVGWIGVGVKPHAVVGRWKDTSVVNT